MAKKEKQEIKGYNPRGFIVSGIIMFVVILVNMIITNVIYWNGNQMYSINMGANQLMKSINDSLNEANNYVVQVAGGIGDTRENILNIKSAFESIRENMDKYESMEGHSDATIKRYNTAKAFINQYDAALLQLESGYEDLPVDIKRNLYIQELMPLQVTASEMLNATADLGRMEGEKRVYNNKIHHGVSLDIMILFFLIGEAAIGLSARNAKRRALELEEREREIIIAGQKLEHSKEKMLDIALTNVLTGMKNRYALETDIEERLESDSFNIGVFDIDNFRNLNDMYGYNFGDEYLATMAEHLASEYSEFAEVYNISGNEFCFIFNDDVPDTQAQRIAERIRQSMSTPVSVAGVTVQMTASGAIYHYLPSDSLSVDALLIKMDTALHNVKRNGGNAVYTINSL